MRHLRIIILAFLVLILMSCANQEANEPATGPTHLPAPTGTASPLKTPTEAFALVENAVRTPTPSPEVTAGEVATHSTSVMGTSLPEPTLTLAPDAWMSLPVVPEKVSERMIEVYRRGLELGNNPQAFSKIGDCGSTPAWFLGDFDRGPRYYRLGEHENLLPAIDFFAGSFSRTSLAAKEGFTASSVFARLWANRSQCGADETPLACEYRVHRPALALIMLGTNDVWHKDSFEPQMRKIIEVSLENGVIPVLSTKADNREGDGSLNATIARLAYEYEIPLWNYWLAVQPLPNGGLQEDGSHITWAPNRFDDPLALQKGWPVRNLTALQMLDLLRRDLNGESSN